MKFILDHVTGTGFFAIKGEVSVEGVTRSEIAKKCGVNIETLRYYEQCQIIDPPPRSRGVCFDR